MRQIPLNARGDVPGFVVVAGDGWHHGVIGIVASRLKDRLKRPVAVIGWEGGTGKGSARSVAGLNLLQHMSLSRETFLKLGGHRGACGFSLSRQDPGELSERLSRDLPESLLAQHFVGTEVDALLEIAQLNSQAAQELASFEPYGHGFERPRFAVTAAVRGVKRMGAEKTHLSLTLDGSPFRAVAFNQADVSGMLEEQIYSEFVGELVLNQFQGRKTPQWHVEQFIGVSPSRSHWPEQTIFAKAPEDISGRVVYVVNTTQQQKRWADKLGAMAFYHYDSLGKWARTEELLQTTLQGAVVLNQWVPLPHLTNWADAIVWLSAPFCWQALASAGALLQEQTGKMWVDPELQKGSILRKAQRLSPGRQSLGSLWKAWESGRYPLLVGARILRELDLHPGNRPSARRQLTDSPSYRRAQRMLASVERDWQIPIKEWGSKTEEGL
jgi:single-stranded-DNA-specific exonuclease